MDGPGRARPLQDKTSLTANVPLGMQTTVNVRPNASRYSNMPSQLRGSSVHGPGGTPSRQNAGKEPVRVPRRLWYMAGTACGLLVCLLLKPLVLNFSTNLLAHKASTEDALFKELDEANSGKDHMLPSVAKVAGPVAYAIPVGGKTQRLPLLKRMLLALLRQGIRGDDIFVFEDDSSRPQTAEAQADRHALDLLCSRWKVNLVRSNVLRNRQERKEEFGLFLARHYHFMLDALLYDGTSSPKTTSSLKNTHVFGHSDPRVAMTHAAFRDTRVTYEYAVLLEDDLELADDAVAFFSGMTWPMSKDPTLFCACAHQDNAYHGMSQEPPVWVSDESTQTHQFRIADSAVGGHFEFRRGEHFMAPGWMTSRRVYNAVVRPTWFDLRGELLPWAKERMYNGNWDTYLDFRVEGMECAFPTIPRIAHRGASGYTVRKDRQDAVFGSLRLSTLPSTMDYKEYATKNLVLADYQDNMFKFIQQSTVIHCLERIEQLGVRRSNLVLHMTAMSKFDPAWTRLFTGQMGLIAVGGHTARMRGVHRGAVLVNYLSNLILVVGSYSSYSGAVFRRAAENTVPAFQGCAVDEVQDRDLPVLKDLQMLQMVGKNPLAVERCACECSPYKYAALQNGGECFCGNSFGKHAADEVQQKSCQIPCDASRARNEVRGNGPEWCGGPLSNAVYETKLEHGAPSVGEHVMVGKEGESCDEVCAAKSDGAVAKLVCDDALLPTLLTGAHALSKELGCTQGFRPGATTAYRNVAPGATVPGECWTTLGRHVMCHAKAKGFKRACVCIMDAMGLGAMGFH